MIKRNENLSKLQAGYLFPEINRRKRLVQEQFPNERIISLGIGNTTEPLTETVVKGIVDSVTKMGTVDGYSGYGDEQGLCELRERIADVFYGNCVLPEEVFVSDGSKCDIGRLQLLFGSKATVAVQDPSYPVYVDGSVLIGATGQYDEESEQFEGIEYLECTQAGGFFPCLEKVKRTDVIYFCSPNNPTGAVATKKQLKALVDFAKKNKSLIVFDAAYSEFIQDPTLPKSILDIEGAREVAIEVNSFSKPIGFTGVRLGWTVVPKELKYEDGKSVIQDWNRIMTTVFNGASIFSQSGGLAALTSDGVKEMKTLISYYMENAKFIKKTLDEIGIKAFGGENAPYIWAFFDGEKSWDKFSYILENAFVVTTPGAGFGPGGEGYVRFSAFGHRADIIEACSRLKDKL